MCGGGCEYVRVSIYATKWLVQLLVPEDFPRRSVYTLSGLHSCNIM